MKRRKPNSTLLFWAYRILQKTFNGLALLKNSLTLKIVLKISLRIKKGFQ
jgi:hypothetical protein